MKTTSCIPAEIGLHHRMIEYIHQICLKLTEWALKYYKMLLIVGLVIFAIIDWLWLVPYDKELGVNIFTNAIFTIFTIIFLMSLIEYRENHRWKLVEKKVKARITQVLSWIYEDFTDLCAQTIAIHDKGMTTIPTKDYRLTKEMLQQLLDNAPKYVSLFERRLNYLSDIELRYARFLDAELTLSIMRIQDDLYEIIVKIEKQIAWALTPKEEFNVSLSENIKRMMMEIEKILPRELPYSIDREPPIHLVDVDRKKRKK
ncbi:MAG: hypothetical protein QW540_10655 [Archaeoglobaceae archaeon]